MTREQSTLRTLVACVCAIMSPCAAAQAGDECTPRWVSLSEGPMAINGMPDAAMLTVGEGSRLGPATYMLGLFSMTPETPLAYRLARWDDSGWSIIPIAASSAIAYSTTLHGEGVNEAVYFGGHFRAARSGLYGSVAKWDGADFSVIPDSALSGVGNLYGVPAMTSWSHNGQTLLVVGGQFSAIGATPASNIAAWNGESWIEVGGGLGEEEDAVLALATFDDGSGPAVYATGWFTDQIGDKVSQIARWSGGSWEHIGYDLGSRAKDFAVIKPGGALEPGLYAGGAFTVNGDTQGCCVARWNGSGWDAVGSMYTAHLNNIEAMNDGNGMALFVAGRILLEENSQERELVVKWDGERWISLGAGAGSTSSGYFLGAFPGSPLAPPVLFIRGNFNNSPAGDARFAAWQACSPASCAGDANGDNLVNFADLNAVLGDFGASGMGLPGDLNGDGAVDFADLNLVLSNFGQGC